MEMILIITTLLLGFIIAIGLYNRFKDGKKLSTIIFAIFGILALLFIHIDQRELLAVCITILVIMNLVIKE